MIVGVAPVIEVIRPVCGVDFQQQAAFRQLPQIAVNRGPADAEVLRRHLPVYLLRRWVRVQPPHRLQCHGPLDRVSVDHFLTS